MASRSRSTWCARLWNSWFGPGAPSDAGGGGGNASLKPNGDASRNGAAHVGPGPIYYGGTLDPVIVEARRDPTPAKRDSASARLARRSGRIREEGRPKC